MMNLRRKGVHYQRVYLQSFLCLQTASIRHFDVTRTAQNVPTRLLHWGVIYSDE